MRSYALDAYDFTYRKIKTMKKRYSRRHICEAIAYWKKQLRNLNENSVSDGEVNRRFMALVDEFGPKIANQLINTQIIGMKPNNTGNLSHEQKKAKLLGIIMSCINSLKDLVYGSDREHMNEHLKFFINEAKYYSQIFDRESWDASKDGFNSSSISEERVGEIGGEIEQKVAEAFNEALENGQSIIPGDPIVTEDNIDDLQEDVLDKLFGGGNNPSKNDIGPDNAYNLYGDLIPCDPSEFAKFYNYVKENGY